MTPLLEATTIGVAIALYALFAWALLNRRPRPEDGAAPDDRLPPAPSGCRAYGCESPRGTRLVSMDNGKSYCPRCAEEIEASGWAKPVRNATRDGGAS
ncbi:MAG: hypothetical protein AB7G21_09705 [Dehalococcoidia bacterium]